MSSFNTLLLLRFASAFVDSSNVRITKCIPKRYNKGVLVKDMSSHGVKNQTVYSSLFNGELILYVAVYI